jgi:uncharacterized membrane protein (UPF0127 family)
MNPFFATRGRGQGSPAAVRHGSLGRTLAVAALAATAVFSTGRAGAAEFERLEVVTARGAQVFRVEVVDTDETRARGLMFRTEMAADQGMLFDFRREESVAFWMKNTYLPLDMIFVRADGKIRSIAADTTPLSEAPVAAGGPVRFVLEVNAGTAARLGIRPGDTIVHPRVRTAK